MLSLVAHIIYVTSTQYCCYSVTSAIEKNINNKCNFIPVTLLTILVPNLIWPVDCLLSLILVLKSEDSYSTLKRKRARKPPPPITLIRRKYFKMKY